jgi:hypothetical protein
VHAEQALDVLPALVVVDDEVDLRVIRGAVDEAQARPVVAAVPREVGRDRQPFQHLDHGATADHPTQAEAVLERVLRCRRAPQLVGDRADPVVALRMARQAAAAIGLRTDDRRPVADQILDLRQCRRVDRVALREREQRVARAVGEHEAPVADGHRVEQDADVDDVVVVPRRTDGRLVVDRERVERGRAGALEEAHVGDGPALLEHEGAARQVVDERLRHRPPDQVRADVRARVVREAGQAGPTGAVRGGVEGDVVEPVDERLVGEELEVVRPVAPVPPGGERLGVDDGLAVGVRGTGDLLDVVHAPLLGPELAAHEPDRAEGAQRINRTASPDRRSGPARLGRQQQAPFAEERAAEAVVVLDHQVADQARPVVQEALARVVVGRRALEQEQVRRRVVFVSLAEDVEDVLRPRVKTAALQLEAVHLDVAQRRGVEGADSRLEAIEHVREVRAAYWRRRTN